MCVSGHRQGLVFTGERLVPGEVEPQLWNEHISRYRFAALFAPGRRALDAGCGTGYGTEILASLAESAVGFDISSDAIRSARASFLRPSYFSGSATSFPFPDSSFDLVTAFELIEHLSDWKSLIEESARVLTRKGLFLVSTPNTEYYAEARGPSGPNPFHVHEFTYAEYKSALKKVFPYVQILAQNQQESITFSGAQTGIGTTALIPPTDSLGDAHFFLAVCSFVPLEVPYFAHVASSHNLLRERERHIRGLQGELALAQHQYDAFERSHQRVLDHQKAQTAHLEHLQAELNDLRHQHEQVRNSAWVKLGRTLGIGPWSDYRARIRIQMQRLQERRVRLGNRLQQLAKATTRSLTAAAIATRNALILVVTPLLVVAAAFTLALVDLCFLLFGRKKALRNVSPDHQTASIVIPTWNGLDLLRAHLPAVMRATAAVPDVEVIVVDDGSTDGSAAFVRANYPQIRLLELKQNRGFAEACNQAAKMARHDVVIFLNNDMRPEEDFVTALLGKFADPLVFAVSSQIFFADTARLREETGLTEVWWQAGHLGVGHKVDPHVREVFPCAYPGGGSSAYDRLKFLELGGFDHLYQPFYYEDTDLGFGAWKRGWKVLYEPASVVHHQHRGTIGKTYSPAFIDSVVRRNAMLYCWKNIHDWRLLITHFRSCLLLSMPASSGKSDDKPCSPVDIRSAFGRLSRAASSRWSAHQLSEVSDREAFHRPLGGYFRDRFQATSKRPGERLNVLLVSPYPIEPPTHGGAVFMRESIHALAEVANVHLVSFVDIADQLETQKALLAKCQSATFLVRPHVPLTDQWTLMPNAIREFGNRDFAWTIHRTMLQEQVDVLQLEYTTMGQYAGEYRRIPCMLFEHDISLQSLWRRIRSGDHDGDLILEYLRMRLYEPQMLKRMTRVQVCSDDNARLVGRLVPGLRSRIDWTVRAAIDVATYHHDDHARETDSLLFIGSFRHSPNVDALRWFVHDVLPLIRNERPSVVLNVIGSGAPTGSSEWTAQPGVRLLGAVPEVKTPLQRYSVFVCPVLSGSGVRVKLLEAFASGIPAVATHVGAEGLRSSVGPVCEVAETADDFARAVLRLLSDETHRKLLAANARQFVEKERDSQQATARLEALYRREVLRMRGSLKQASPELQTGVAEKFA